ncbi:putative holin, class II [Salmonella phage vB_SenS-Ent1]|uniref:Putative holin, class II n=1 Tax=Salmonella phage vB_SenS-Ent1 TaxID=1163482 RepID=I2G845_9CAUD|nr:holin [Salmonella phage vB_SenS-Ent1]CCG55233.1 putative holin, class II [Salmonella phage vB_SenS-Ent1]
MLNSQIGAICLAAIIATSLINIYAHWIEDGLFGRLLYMASAMTATSGLAHLVTGAIPPYIITTLIAILTLKSIRHICVKGARWYKYRRMYVKPKH